MLRKTGTRPPREWRGGATMIELVIVVTIMGILAAVALPRYFNAMDLFRAEAAAKRVQMDLELARQNAKLAGTTRTVTFDADAETYTLSGIADPDHPAATYTVDLTGTGYSALLVSADFGGNTDLTFDRYGKPDNGGTVVVQAGSYQKTVAIDGTTGRATIP